MDYIGFMEARKTDLSEAIQTSLKLMINYA